MFQDAVPRLDVSEFPPYNFENKFLQYDIKILEPLQNEELVLQNSADLVSPVFRVPDFYLCYLVSIRKKTMPAEDDPSRAGRLAKTFPEVPHEVVHRAASKNRG